MMMAAMKLLHSVWQLGCSSRSDFDNIKRIILSNQVYTIYLLALAAYSIYFFILHHIPLSLITIFFSLICIFCLLLNRYSYFFLSRFFFIVSIAIANYIFPAIIGSESSIQFACFPIMAITFILFEYSHWLVRFLLTGLHIISYFFLELFECRFFYHIANHPFNMLYFKLSVFLCISILLLLILSFYSSLTFYYKQTLQTILNAYSITNRESEIINLTIKGKSNKEISTLLFIEESTVKGHLRNIFKKLSVSSRSHLIVKLTQGINLAN